MLHNFYDENSLPRLTIDELRAFKGLECLTDSEANDAINALVQLAIVVYNLNN